MNKERAIEILEHIVKWGRADDGDYSIHDNSRLEAIEMAITALKESNGENRPKGHWIYPDDGYPISSPLYNHPYMWKSICSNCNTGFPIITKDYKFCPECNADMRGK